MGEENRLIRIRDVVKWAENNKTNLAYGKDRRFGGSEERVREAAKALGELFGPKVDSTQRVGDLLRQIKNSDPYGKTGAEKLLRAFLEENS